MRSGKKITPAHQAWHSCPNQAITTTCCEECPICHMTTLTNTQIVRFACEHVHHTGMATTTHAFPNKRIRNKRTRLTHLQALSMDVTHPQKPAVCRFSRRALWKVVHGDWKWDRRRRLSANAESTAATKRSHVRIGCSAHPIGSWSPSTPHQLHCDFQK